MNFALFGKPVTPENANSVGFILEKLKSITDQLFIYRPFLESIPGNFLQHFSIQAFYHHQELKNVDVLLSIGGDGTLLDTVTLVRDSGIPILGINTGRLGFLSAVPKDAVDKAFTDILQGRYVLDQRSLINLKTPNNLFGELNFALNEVTIHKKGNPTLIHIKVFIDKYLLNAYWADGLIVATPTGSTGYSLSCGGPIVVPGSESFIITPIASHNLTVRPVVIPDTSVIHIRVSGRIPSYQVGLDARYESFGPETELEITKEKFTVNLVQFHDFDFFGTIREKLKWGFDARN